MTSAVPYAEVIGDPIGHSKSPLIHRFWLKKLGLDYDYRATRVTSAELPVFLEARRKDPLWRGCNVTMPLKRDVLQCIYECSSEVEVIGAANTIVRVGADSRLQAHNTDWIGVREPLAKWCTDPRGGGVAIIGTGGAAAAATATVLKHRAGILISNYGRSHQSALAFRERVDKGEDDSRLVAPIDDLADAANWPIEATLLINASPLGMRGHPRLDVDLSRMTAGSIVFDMVYDPPETDLLRQARALGLTAIDGLAMLVAQAAAAFELFVGEPAPREFDAELREMLRS
jgi:shikimate dehydrogenase